MKEIIEENYQSIIDRGLISERTTIRDFLIKLDEEVLELNEYYKTTTKVDNKELADVILVCLNFAKHLNIDIEYELKTKIEINKNRKPWKTK